MLDYINHSILLEKLITVFNFSERSSLLVKNYLSEQQQVMRVNDSILNTDLVLTGVPQGSVLRSLLFTMFINELTAKICNEYVFADDCLLKTSGSSPTIPTTNMENTPFLQFGRTHMY